MVTLVSEWKNESKQEDDSSKYVPPDARDINKAAASGVTAWRRDGGVICYTCRQSKPRGKCTHTHNCSWCYKLFWRDSGKSRLPISGNSKNRPFYVKAINSFRVYICLKLELFSNFSAGSDIETNFFTFLNFGEICISSKNSFITSTTGLVKNISLQ